MEREVGGGIGMGNTCKPMAVSFQCMTKFTTNKKKRVVSSAYLRLLILLLAVMIPACASFSPAFLMMYSAYKLNKQGDNVQA